MESFAELWHELNRSDFDSPPRTIEIGYGNFKKQITYIADRKTKQLGFDNYINEIEKEFQLEEPLISLTTIKMLVQGRKYLLFEYFRKAVSIKETVQHVFFSHFKL